MPSKILDIHPHVISADTQRYPPAPLDGHQSDWSRDRPVSVEQMIAAMDEAGIRKAALVQASTCYGHDNSYVADAVAAHPDRFTGVFSVDVLQPGAVEQIRYWRERGLAGVRLFTAGSTMASQADWLDDPRSFPTWKYAGEAGIPICVQMRPPGIGMLTRMLERFPDVQVVLDHMGRPAFADGPPYTAAANLFGLARFGNLYLKLTVHNVRDARQGRASPETLFTQVVGQFGAARLAWGSNYPASEGTLTDIVLESLRALAALSDDDREWIFYRTAEKLYPALAEKRMMKGST